MKVEPLATRGPAQDFIEFVHALSVDTIPAPLINRAKWSKIMADEMLTEASRGSPPS